MDIKLDPSEVLQLDLYTVRARQLKLQLAEIEITGAIWLENLRAKHNAPEDKYEFKGNVFVQREESRIITPMPAMPKGEEIQQVG